MPLYALDEKLWFPPVDGALEDGLWQWAATSTKNRLLLAYKTAYSPGSMVTYRFGGAPTPDLCSSPMNLK